MNKVARKQIIARAQRRAHHLWKAAEEDGRTVLRRERPEEELEMTAKRRKASNTSAEDLGAVYWGLFGASLVDDKTLSSEIPRAIASRFNVTASKTAEVPRIHGWDELRRAFGSDEITKIRKDISFGMQTRLASKYFNLPFLAAADIVYGMGNADHGQVKDVIGMIRQGKRQEAETRYGDMAVELAKIYNRYMNPESRKIAIDVSAKDYWETYLGPFGKEMVREIKKRVRADLAQSWLRKHGVDQAAAEYWSKYYGAYGEKWVSVVPKMIRPKKSE